MLAKLKEISKPALGKLLFVAAFVIVFILVKELKSDWFQSKSMQETSERATDKTAREIKSARTLATADKSTTEVLVEKSYWNTTTTLSSANTQKQKLAAASNFFFGAYFLNTRTRADYCTSLDVPIKSFVGAYKQMHHDLFVSAEKIQIIDFQEHGQQYDIENFYQLVAPSNKTFITQEMKDATSSLNISERELCQSFERNSADWVKEMDYRKRAPEIAQLLLSR